MPQASENYIVKREVNIFICCFWLRKFLIKTAPLLRTHTSQQLFNSTRKTPTTELLMEFSQTFIEF